MRGCLLLLVVLAAVLIVLNFPFLLAGLHAAHLF